MLYIHNNALESFKYDVGPSFILLKNVTLCAGFWGVSESSPEHSIRFRTGFCAGQSGSSTQLCCPCLYGPWFVHWSTVKPEQKEAISKLFPQSWEHEIV